MTACVTGWSYAEGGALSEREVVRYESAGGEFALRRRICETS